MYQIIQQWPLFLTTAIIAVIIGQLGVINGWTSPELPYLQSEDSPIPVTSSEGSTLAILSLAGELLANPIVVFCNERYGRKFTIFFSIVPIISSWLLIAFAKYVWQLILARVLGGVGIIFIMMGGPIYVGEVAPEKMKGSLLLTLVVTTNAGIVWMYILGLYPVLWFPAVVSIIPLLLMLFFVVWFPESPHFLLKKNKKDLALKSLQKLRNTENVLEEFNKIQMTDTEKYSYKDFFKTKSNFKPLVISLVVVILIQLTGGLVLTMNTHLIFQKAGNVSKDLLSIIRSVLQLVTSMISCYIIDFMKRKKLLIYTCSSITIIMAIEGTYFLLQEKNYNVDNIWWLPILCLGLYNMVSNIGLISIQVVFIAELFHPKMRSAALGLTWFWSSICIIITGKLFQIITDNFCFCTPFYLFSLVAFLGLLFVIVFVPETKDKSLEDLQHYFEHNKFKSKMDDVNL